LSTIDTPRPAAVIRPLEPLDGRRANDHAGRDDIEQQVERAHAPRTRPHVGFGTLLLYGFGACSIGIKTRALNNFLLIFYNQALGMRPETVALAVTIITVIEAVGDPLIGFWSDNLRSRLGRRHPLIYASAIPIAVSFYFLWNPPSWLSPDMMFFYLLGCLFILRMATTAFEIPSVSLGPELVPDYHRRSVITSMRIFFRTISGLLFAIAAFQIFLSNDHGGVTNRSGYLAFAITGSLVMLAAVLCCGLATHRFIPWLRKPSANAARPSHFVKDVAALWRVPAARIVLLVSLLVAIQLGSDRGLELYFGLYFWQMSQAQLSLIATLTAVATLMGSLIGPAFGKRFGKLRGTLIGLPISLAIMITPVLLRLAGALPPNGSPVIFVMLAATAFVQGLLYMIMATLMNSMMSDVVEELEVTTGKRSEGLLFSADAFFSKAVSGVGVLISGGILWAIAFPVGAKPGQVAPDIVWHLGAIYVPIITLLSLAVIAVQARFPIDEARHKRNLATLSDRATEEMGTPIGIAP